jgi:valyl-tRNA synthetase
MNDQLKTKELVNKWIINELAILQKNYFYHLEKNNINLATNQIIKFVKERLSNEYLELIKVYSWDTNTKNTLLFVYQQLLTILHPAIPFITEYLYQELAREQKAESQ